MRSSIVAIIALVFLATIVGSSAVAANGQVALTVSVVNQDDEGVADATVVATWDGGEATGTTASNGRVFIDVPQGADVELDIEDERYIRNRPLSVSDAEEQDVELRVSRQATATVAVVDTDDQPLSGATVRLRKGVGTVSSGETDDSGVFQSAVVEAGEYEVTAVKPGYYRASRDLRVENETEAEITLESGRVSLEIEVVDDHFDPPRTLSEARIQVRADDFDANVSATDGSASLNVPVNARYRITASKEGYKGTPRVLSVSEAPKSITVAAQRPPELVVTAESDRVIVGERTRIEVRNAYDELVPGVEIRIDGEAVGETDDRGELSIQIDAAGDRTIVASHGEVESDPITVTGIDPDADTDGDSTDASEESTDSPEEDPSDPEETPGFGVPVALVAFLIALAVVVYRR